MEYIRQKRKRRSLLPLILFLFVQAKGDFKKLKDYFVPDSYLFNQWMEVYSRSELGGVLPYFFYQLQVPISILFILYINWII